MRVAVVVAAMLFCVTGCSRNEIQKSVTNSIGMELIEIPAGKFTMGSPEGEKDRFSDYEDQVRVTLTQPLELGKYEVTQGQWKSVMGTEPWLNQGGVQIGEENPVTYVNWDDATEFCKTLTATERKAGTLKSDEEYRLPTDAKWEYACRAGTKTAFSFGDDESKLGEYARFRGNAVDVERPRANKVGLKKPNPWGLHDMHGNVCEWCWDWYDEKRSDGTDPVGPEKGLGRVIRGGSWWNDPGSCRSAYLRIDNPAYSTGDWVSVWPAVSRFSSRYGGRGGCRSLTLPQRAQVSSLSRPTSRV